MNVLQSDRALLGSFDHHAGVSQFNLIAVIGVRQICPVADIGGVEVDLVTSSLEVGDSVIIAINLVAGLEYVASIATCQHVVSMAPSI